MLGKVTLCFFFSVIALTVNVPCVIYLESTNGNATDCTISRVDSLTLSWGVLINFHSNFNWTEKSYINALIDMGNPQSAVPASKSSCNTKADSYTKGQSVLINCTQSFSIIPVGFSNVVKAFNGDG